MITFRASRHGLGVNEALVTSEGTGRCVADPSLNARGRLQALLDTGFEVAWRTALRLGVPQQAAEDVAQEAFIVVSRKLPEVEVGRERAFLLATTVRLAANWRRSARARKETADEDQCGGVRDPAPGADELLGQKRKRELLEQVLGALPDPLREVFVLFELEGLSSFQIGEILGIPAPTARSRLRRAREEFFSRVRRLRQGAGEEA